LRADNERHSKGGLPLLLAVILLGCGGAADAPPSIALTGFARMTSGEMAQPSEGARGVESPQRVEGVELSPDLARELKGLDQQLTAVVRVMIAADGTVMGAKILESRPEELELTQRFADEVTQGVWDWRYRPAYRNGEPVRAILDLTFTSD